MLRDQLLEAGIRRGAIEHRLRTGRLHRFHRGVYLVGRETLDPLGAEMAAVLHFAGYAVVSHRSAAAIWGLVEASPPDVTVTLLGRHGHSRPGLTVHRIAALERRDLRVRSGLPVTSPPRTILDLAADLGAGGLEQAISVARQRGLASERELRGAIARAPGHRGAGRLIRLLHDADHGLTRSWAERRMRALIRAAQLPQPWLNVPLHGYVADFLWQDARLILEFDGYGSHGDRAAFEHDRKRDQVLVAAGYRVIRVTYLQLRDEPFAVVARLTRALSVGS